jgi:hypothetical protein
MFKFYRIVKMSEKSLDKSLDKSLEKEYVDQLTPFQKIAHDIAVKKLGSSFNLSLSIGFLEFLAARPKTPGT